MRAGGRARQPRRRLDKWVGSRGGPTMSATAQAGGRSRRAGHTAAAQLLHAAARPQGCVFLALRLRRTYTPTWTAERCDVDHAACLCLFEGLVRGYLSVSNSLVCIYSKLGEMEEAEKFSRMLGRRRCDDGRAVPNVGS